MSLDLNLIWTILQVVALLIIAREIDRRIRKRKNRRDLGFGFCGVILQSI